MSWRTHLPHTTDDFAVTLADRAQSRKLRMRVRITQLIGGKRWSLALITNPRIERG